LGQEHTGEQTLTIPIKRPEDILPFLHPTTTKLKWQKGTSPFLTGRVPQLEMNPLRPSHSSICCRQAMNLDKYSRRPP